MHFLRPQLLRQFNLRTMAYYYAVSKGRKVGVYETWAQCEEQVKGFKGAVFKKFNTRFEAEQFVAPTSSSSSSKYKPQDVAVPLGHKEPPPITWKQEFRKNETGGFWPDDLNDEVEKNMTEDDLVTALNEVEGLPAAKKRKAGDIDVQSKIPRHESTELKATGIKRVGEFDFLIDAEGYVIVYTDGSCLRNGQANAAAGFGVYFGENHKLNAAKPVLGRVTNNVGEIQASIYAIKLALDLGITKLCICTDSQFLINSITLWVKGWKQRNWRLKNNQPVKNVVDFQELDALLQSDNINVKWNYVEAHKGIKGNEMADKLARQGSQLYRELKNS